MINIDKLESILDGYITYFPDAWEKGEKTKWEAVKWFQDHWDIEATDFGEMFKTATEKTSMLLTSGHTFPRLMILNFANADAEATREMFRKLYDESLSLLDRVDSFQKESEALRTKYNDGTWKKHFQNTNAISTYLWLRYPDKYYIYKYELANAAAVELSSDYQPKANGSADSMVAGFHLYDDICDVVKTDTRIRDIIKSVKTDSCYADPEMKTVTIDVVFYMKRFIIDERKEEKSLAKKERTISEAIKIVLKDKSEGMTIPQIYSKIIDNKLYEFNAQNPQSVVTSTIRSSCVGVENKFTTRVREFVIVREEGDEIYYALNNGFNSKDGGWFPSIEEYDPGLSVEDWLALLNDNSVFNDDSITIVSRFLDFGGSATCTQLVNKYGNTVNFYNKGSSALAERIYKKTNCQIMMRDDGGTRWWAILYVGRKQDKDAEGEWIWKLREELKEALEKYNSVKDIRCWIVGAYSDSDNTHQDEEFIQKGIWQNGYTDKFLDVVNRVKVGDKIAIKTSYVKKNDLPFDNQGKSISVMKIKIVGTVTANHMDGRTLDVEWDKSFIPKEWYFYTFRNTISLPKEGDWRTRALINFIFNDVPQDYAKFQKDAENTEEIELAASNSEFLKYFAPLIQALKELGGSATRKEAHEKVIEIMDISDEELSVTYEKSGASRILNQIDFARNDLAHEGLISSGTKGVWALTELGANIDMTLELAGLIHMKWVKINTAKRNNEAIPEIDLSKYYAKKKEKKYTEKDFLNEVFITAAEYKKLRSLVERKKNVILQGAPGVGKTYSAKRLAYSIIGEENENRICMVQFHQNYSYEDFIMGYRPNDKSGFELQSGVFYNFCERCKENPKMPYFFIIDEINRGNLSKIFGELLMLIETDKRGENHKINLVYGGTSFYIPDNLHIIGMMNTADRSLAMIDYALRRRFSFYTMSPAFEKADDNGFGDYLKGVDNCDLYHKAIAAIIALNKRIREELGKGFEIGHSYFTPEDPADINDEWVKNVIEYEIIPLIEEYWFDNDETLKDEKDKLYQAIGENDDD